MNETKKRAYWIESLIGVGSTMVIAAALALYMLNEPSRITGAQAKMLNDQLDDAMTLYSENCAVCHGGEGQGIGSTPPLNRPALQTMPFEELQKTISRGRYQTAMPAWSIADGGPLSDYQIDELVLLVQYGDWNETGDRVVNLGYAPLIPFISEPDPVLFAQVGQLPDGTTLQNAIQLFATNCVSCHGADGLGTGIAPTLNDADTRAKTAEELTRTLAYGNTGTLMTGWSNTLATEQISALITLITRWEEIPAGTIPAPDIPVPTTEESIALGGQLFAANCSRCHGPEGQGTPRAPSLNVKSFLTDTNDQAMLQIITSGVPGTAMPAWGDRMADAEIQAIVGFIRQWEPTAPEVAVLTRPGGGGPPWRNNTSAQSPGLLPSSSYTRAGPSLQGTQSTQILDWRILILTGVILSAAFSLISAGFSSLQKTK